MLYIIDYISINYIYHNLYYIERERERQADPREDQRPERTGECTELMNSDLKR